MQLPFASVTTRAARGFGAIRAGLPQMVASPLGSIAGRGFSPVQRASSSFRGVYVSAHRTYSVGGATRRQSRPRRLVHQINQGFLLELRGEASHPRGCAATPHRNLSCAQGVARRRIISTQRSYAHRAASQANTNAQSKRTPRLPRSLTPRSHRPGRRTKRPPPPPRRPAASGARQRAAHVEPTPAPRSAPAAPRMHLSGSHG